MKPEMDKPEVSKPRIEIRKIPFEFDTSIPPIWNPARPEWSHMVNGASLTMPYLEPFLIKNLREAIELIDDNDLKEDARGFIGQEAQHYTNHRRYNETLKHNGYPELADVEASMEAGFADLAKRSLAWRLAYTAGFETMTMGITEWLINQRGELFRNADPVVTSLVLWHMVEETEHKSVAYDVYQAVSGNYFLRIAGLLYGSLHVAILSRRGYKAMLMRDGTWSQLQSRIRLWKMIARFFIQAGPAMLRALMPGYHPDKVNDPVWVARWSDAYAGLDQAHLPLLNTRHRDIAPEFTSPN